MVAGAVVTGGCMYATAGAATPACLMAGGATAGALSGASHCDGMNSACVRRVLVEASAGAVTGLFGGSGGSVLRSAGRMLAGAEGAGLRAAAREATVAADRSTFLGNMARGGTANAVYDGIVQVGTTGTIDFKQVGESFVSGAVLAGGLHLGASGARRWLGKSDATHQPNALQHPMPTPGSNGRTLYRADSRTPAEIFGHGFTSKGDNLDLETHVRSNPPDSGYISTTHALRSAQDFADEHELEYIYKLRGDGVDVNDLLGDASPFPWEKEVSIIGKIDPRDIEGAWGPDGWIPNPDFEK